MTLRSPSTIQYKFTILLLHLFVTAQIFPQQTPYYGIPLPIPGIIEAEDFDNGGEGVAYHDTEAGNSGGQYRDTDVDIETSSEGGYNIGWIYPGEWLEYSVDVAYSGMFSFEIRVASPAEGGTIHFEFQELDVTGSVSFDATSGWQTWGSVLIPGIELNNGPQVMRFVVEAGAFNLNHFNIVSTQIPDPPTVEITAPLDNSEFYHGDDILITAAASDPNGTVTLVEFYADEQKIGEDASEPFEYLWLDPEMGNWDLFAVATDNDGAQTTSTKVDISVNFPDYDYEVWLSDEDHYHTSAFDLILSTGLTNSEIWYTLDGSNPLQSGLVQISDAPLTIEIDPGDISSGRGSTPGVVLRAVVFANGLQQSRIKTQTYLFLNEVPSQTYPGGAWPDQHVNGQLLYYSVNQDVVNDEAYSSLIDDALLDIPSISLVTDLDDLFGSDSGIYVNAQFHGIEWERPVSVELCNPDGSPGFQIDAGLRIRGGWSRHDEFPKHAFRLFFREQYGDNKLQFPLFGDEGVDEFKKVDLRTSQNYAWSNGGIWENTMNRDVFSRDLQAAMGQPYTRSRYYHLYLNGMYWGLYQTQERPEANYAESYLGGNDDDYDVVKVDIGEDWSLYEIEATDGNLDAWEQVWNACETGFSSLADYFALEGNQADGTPDPSASKLVDIDNLIDYMLIIFYTGNIDAPVSKFRGDLNPNNFYAIYNREANDGFVFLTHDSEHTLLVNPHWPSLGLAEDRVNIEAYVGNFVYFHPQWLHNRLAGNAEYRLRFADRVYRHLFNDGVMQPDNLVEIFNGSAEDIDLAIIGESMRWGDLERSKNNAWLPAIDLIVNDFFPQRGQITIDQLKEAALYPEIDPPLFKVNGIEFTESILEMQGGVTIEFEIPDQGLGSIIYTLDGSDPRAIGGGFGSNALAAGDHQLIAIDETSKLRARLYNGGVWSALHEITIYSNDDLAPLTLTEIHYHPLDEGTTDGKNYEFLELYNSGAYSLNLSLLTFANGIDYTFPNETLLEEGGLLVLASSADHFAQRYEFEPFGIFAGQLDNSGERLTLANVNGDTIITLRYDDNLPWPEAADGDGPSLVWTNQTQDGNANNPANWSASSNIHGSPGLHDPLTTKSSELHLPDNFSLSQNYPNPFNPSTTIRYGLPSDMTVSLVIYDVRGQVVHTVTFAHQSAGWHDVLWRGETAQGKQVSTGIYFARLEGAGPHSARTHHSEVIKMLMIK